MNEFILILPLFYPPSKIKKEKKLFHHFISIYNDALEPFEKSLKKKKQEITNLPCIQRGKFTSFPFFFFMWLLYEIIIIIILCINYYNSCDAVW